MEKIAYKLWKNNSESLGQFKAFLLQDLVKTLQSQVIELQINIADDDVKPALQLAQSSYPASPDAVVSIKVASSYYSENIMEYLQTASRKVEGFIVSESVVLHDESKDQEGQRSEGFSQIVFLEKPENMSSFDWFDHWTHHHTKIAIETQSNFTYIQNTIVRPLQESSPRFIAIIEECFPSGAMSDPSIFYDAQGNTELLSKNIEVMMDSCKQFIDFTKIEVIPTSRYRMIESNKI